MGERQLRNRSMATGVETAPQDSESCHEKGNSSVILLKLKPGETKKVTPKLRYK